MLKGKQKRYLRGLGANMDPVVHVGKGGVVETLERTAEQALKAHELIKVKVLETAPETANEIGPVLAEALEADLVQVIGRNFLLYRRNAADPRIKLP